MLPRVTSSMGVPQFQLVGDGWVSRTSLMTQSRHCGACYRPSFSGVPKTLLFGTAFSQGVRSVAYSTLECRLNSPLRLRRVPSFATSLWPELSSATPPACLALELLQALNIQRIQERPRRNRHGAGGIVLDLHHPGAVVGANCRPVACAVAVTAFEQDRCDIRA